MGIIRVILIEDHDLTRIGICTALKQCEGIEVIGEAKDGKSGLKLLKSTPVDIAIIDVGLPDISGIEVTQAFKNSHFAGASALTKILIMTMYDNEETVLAAFAAGADSYYMKDASINRLCEAIRLTYDGNSWIDPAIARIVLRQSQKTYTAIQSQVQPDKVTIKGLSTEDNLMIANYPLTARELDVLKLIVDGCSNAEISDKLYITVGTVKTHVRNILNKLSADDRTQVAVRALRTGLVS
jgi:two-component system, NarL family, response regulator LiaR